MLLETSQINCPARGVSLRVLLDMLLPARRSSFLYMDGYAEHFDEFALNLLRNAHVYIIFLRAQNSENDQPNDNGLNAIFKRCYDVCYATWKGETLEFIMNR